MQIMAQNYVEQRMHYDFHHFLIEMEESYMNIKNQMQEEKQKSSDVLNDKFSLPFQNHYSQLSAKFDSMIQKAQIKFEDHRVSLQDQQQIIDQIMMTQVSPLQQQKLIYLISKLLIRSQTIYDKWIKDEVSNLKEELDLVIVKNFQMQDQLQQVYQRYENTRERLDNEISNRFEIQREYRNLQKEHGSLKEEIQLLTSSNKSLQASMHDLDELVSVNKQAQLHSTHSELLQKDQLQSQIQKGTQLQLENACLTQKILGLQHELQQLRNQQQNFIQEIKHLSEIIDNQNYELDFYKGRDLRESPSIALQSHDKLNHYEDFLESYQNSSHKGSLRSFMLSHQKSMGKLTIFQNNRQNDRDNCEDRVFQKISNPDMSLQSFQNVQFSSLKKHQALEAFKFPDFNQLTFRPEVQVKDVTTSEQRYNFTDNHKDQSESHVEFAVGNQNSQYQQQQTSRFQELEQNRENDTFINDRNVENFIEPLRITGKKHIRQRSQSITEGSPSMVSKKLIYDDEITQTQHPQIEQHPGEQHMETNNPVSYQPDNNQQQRSECSYSQSNNTVHSVCNYNSHFSKTFQHIRKDIQTKSQFKKSFILNHESRRDNFDNKSEANSVNKALIKKNIKVQKEIDQLMQKLEYSEVKIQQYEDRFAELEGQVQFYRQELSKSVGNAIRYKSEIQSYRQEIQAFEANRYQHENNLQQKEIQINQKSKTILQLNQQIQDLTIKLKLQNAKFEQRITKVKEYCKTYIEEKHQKEIEELQKEYQAEIETLRLELEEKTLSMRNPIMEDQQMQTKILRKLQLQSCILSEQIKTFIQKQDIDVQATEKNEQSKIINLRIESVYTLGVNQLKEISTSERLSIDSLVAELQFRAQKSEERKSKLGLYQCCQVVISKVLDSNKSEIENRKILHVCRGVVHQEVRIDKLNKLCQQRHHKSLSFFNFLNQSFVFRTFRHQQQLKVGKLSLVNNIVSEKHEYQPLVSNQVTKIDKSTQNDQTANQNNSLISLLYSIKVSPCFPSTKTPSLSYFKQLLNTPSSPDTLQTSKQSPQTYQSEQPESHKSSNNRLQSSPQDYLLKQHDRFYQTEQRQPQQEEQVEQSFFTVSYIQSLQMMGKSEGDWEKDHKYDQTDSFFTCVQFDSSQSFRKSSDQSYCERPIGNRSIFDRNPSNSAIILQQDIFVVNNNINSSQENLYHIHPIHQDYDQTTQIHKEKHQGKSVGLIEQESNQNELIMAQRQYLSSNQPNYLQEQLPTTQHNSLISQLMKHQPSHNKDDYFNIVLPQHRQNTSEHELYTKIFQKHLLDYFKKHTTFYFQQLSLPSQSIPNPQKMYLIHTEIEPFSSCQQTHQKVNQPTAIKQRFILYKKLLLSLQTQRKLQVPKNAMFKFISDPNRLNLGNFQILVTSQDQLKITRKNKRSFYFGNIEDATYNITAIDQIRPVQPSNKRR